jgi:ribosomal protein S18 acetylase RimI-like enzyme
VNIERLTPESFAIAVPALAGLLVDSVAGGASVGFLAGFDRTAAAAWWRDRAAAVADGSLVVWTAAGPDGIHGTISLAYPDKPNGRHRAEVVKLAVHRAARGRGLGWQRYGTVPDYAAGPSGELKDCSFFYRRLAGNPPRRRVAGVA